jgi:AcrR family transcriptional regulator
MGASSKAVNARKRVAGTAPARVNGDAAAIGVGAETQNTRQRVIDAALECILAKGYYRASSNEIARWAGLSWGVIQYHFGTRERLMLDAMIDQIQKLIEHSENYQFTGTTIREQLWSTYDYLYEFFGRREYLASVEINLNLVRTPSTADEVKSHVQRLYDTMTQVGARNPDHVVSNEAILETLRSTILAHRMRADESLTVAVDDDAQFRARVSLLIEAFARYLESPAT